MNVIWKFWDEEHHIYMVICVFLYHDSWLVSLCQMTSWPAILNQTTNCLSLLSEWRKSTVEIEQSTGSSFSSNQSTGYFVQSTGCSLSSNQSTNYFGHRLEALCQATNRLIRGCHSIAKCMYVPLIFVSNHTIRVFQES